MPAPDPVPLRPVLSADEVARLLRWTCVESFRNNRRKLENAGFPKKLPGCPGWSRAAVMRWIETNGGLDAPAEEQPGNVVRLAKATPLERRFA
ncbi:MULTISPECIES: hypothetical protein [unclassified Mesorhizobium]|uniref:hypothetical protein n=1 Tax=unclassified Mesorhizobium TaxID=325217 RepID=UPI00112B6C0F|nr:MULTISPECIES: hypothetical protein [unclassified Mesorhizobium]TPM06789.1 hypothetical protein FJ939_12045 [Mesorhizobium sp. B2-3-8]TPM15328.1 hypothetical protein FJ940_14060 [Mesorhizobium sp. B2-3-7]